MSLRLRLGLVAALAVLALGCRARGGPPAADDDAHEIVATQTVTFVHVNDLHASYTPQLETIRESRYSRLRGYFEAVKQDQPHTLFTGGGDDFEKGCLAELTSGGQAVIDVTHAMQFDVRVLGNHDFAWGEESLLAFARDPHGIVLASNTTYDGDDPAGFAAVEFAIKQVGALQVGFFGMVSRPWNEKNEQYTGDFFPGGNFHTRFDHAARAQEIVTAHRGEVDLMVMVSHLGLDDDRKLAAQVPGIDVILGGHSHKVLQEPVTQGDTVIIQAGTGALWVARLDVEVPLEGGGVVRTSYQLLPNAEPSADMPPDPQVQAAVERAMATHAPDAQNAVGHLRNAHERAEIARFTARAALATLPGIHAAVVDHETVWQSWGPGPYDPQRFLDTFKVERQPADTPGFNSFYTALIGGADLLRLADELPRNRWSLALGEGVEPGGSYRLAIQKHAAFNPSAYLPPGVTPTDPQPALEVWEVLDRYARGRNGQCLHLDVDERVRGCPE